MANQKETRRLQWSQRQYSLAIPPALVRALGWEKGDKIIFKLDTNRIVLSKEAK